MCTFPAALIYAKSPEYHASSAYFVEGYAAARIAKDEGDVFVRYTYDWKHWSDCPADFLTAAADGSDIYSFKTPVTNKFQCCTFAVCCHTGTKEYWDNNGGLDYRLKWYSPTVILKNTNVLLKSTARDDFTLSGVITLKNLSFEKEVKVLFKSDERGTQCETDAVFSCSLSGDLENWVFNIPLKTKKEKLIISVQYSGGGITCRDDNYGMGYVY